MIRAIDLFAGCGGFSVGFEKDNFDIVSAVEFDKHIGESYSLNHPKTKIYIDDIKNLGNNNTFKKNQAEVIIGGPPCQGFSMAGSRIRNGFIDDPRNYLFKHYFNIVKIVSPKIFVIENVKGLLTMKNGSILKEIQRIFEDSRNFDDIPYKIQFRVFKAEQFGIPQKRERVIIIGSRIDFDLEFEINDTIEYIKSNIDSSFFDKVSIWDAISNLPSPTKNGEVTCLVPESKYQLYLSSKTNKTYNHIETKHSSVAIERMDKIKIDGNYTSLNEDIKSIHSGSYGRMNPFGISTTITTRFDTPSGGRFIHPFGNRTITPREAARLQSFPDDFKFSGTKTSIHKQIGNAVPPKMAYFIAVMIRRILCKKHS
ncbi:MAG: DNA cytosine methyltransferase [Tenericutes bacterium]|nr:DNA cytosine methyltransferase [Mycoplasmatota bacterium]